MRVEQARSYVASAPPCLLRRPEEVVAPDRASRQEGPAWEQARQELELLDAVGADFDVPGFLEGKTTPVLFGSALSNFGVRLLLDALVDLAPLPAAAPRRR